MSARIKNNYFYGILGTIIITMFFSAMIFLLYVKNVISSEYGEKAENVCSQYFSSSQIILDDIVKCVNEFELKNSTSQGIYDALTYIRMCSLDISDAIYAADSNIYISGTDHIFSNYMNKERINELVKESNGQWTLYEFNFMDKKNARLVYVTERSDGSVIVVSAFPERLISKNNIGEDDYYLSDAGITLQSKETVCVLKDNGKIENIAVKNGETKHGIHFVSYELSDGILLNLYLRTKTAKNMFNWLITVIIIFLVFTVISFYVAYKFSLNISDRVEQLGAKMKSYVDGKSEER